MAEKFMIPATNASSPSSVNPADSNSALTPAYVPPNNVVVLLPGSASPSSSNIPALDVPTAALNEADLMSFLRLFADTSAAERTQHAAENADGDAMKNLLNNSSVLLLLSYLSSVSTSEVYSSLARIAAADKDNAKTISDKMIEKIIQAAEDKKAAEKSGLWGKIFGWIATALAVITAVVTVNPALITAAVIMLTMQIDQETGGHILKGMSGGNEKVMEALQWTAMALTIVLSLGACAASVSSISSKIAAVVGKTVSKLGVIFANSSKLMLVSPRIFALAQIAEGIAMVGQGTVGAVKAKQDKNVAETEAARKELAALLALVTATLDFDTDIINKILKQLESMSSTLSSAISAELAGLIQQAQLGV